MPGLLKRQNENMRREVVATPTFVARLQEILDYYAELGAVRFVAQLHRSYAEMVQNISTFKHIAPARKRLVNGKNVVLREYILKAGARDFMLVYFVPQEESEPVVLLNIKDHTQRRFLWEH
jgi:plasmid stabilization system protein ParE